MMRMNKSFIIHTAILHKKKTRFVHFDFMVTNEFNTYSPS